MMTLSRLLEICPPLQTVVSATNSALDERIEDLAYDSRQAGPGTVFFALPGTHTDGHHYLDDVARRGCRAVVVSRVPDPPRPDTVYAVVADPRAALSPWSAALWGHPSRELTVIGVTGTDGKSSTVSFIHQLLTMAGQKAGFYSTVEWNDGESTHHNEGRQSTPEAPQIHRILRHMVDVGCRFAVIEATSHGLSPLTSRLADVIFSAAVFTNVTWEHLEFHGTVENYRRDKSRLFEALSRGPQGAFGVVNRDDPHHRLFEAAAGSCPVLTYSVLSPDADLTAKVQESADRLDVHWTWKDESVDGVIPIPGRFNASNVGAALLACAGALQLAGVDRSPLDLVPLIPGLRAVKGRMSPVREGQPFAVLVDYAHTPGAFEALLPAIRAVTPGKVWIVFGSGGERDRTKRPQQGALAERWTDAAVLTDEDPRLENPDQILDDIAAGFQTKELGVGYWKIRPRRAALEFALNSAQAGDTVLLLGKGHEKTLVTAEGSLPWDDEAEARAILRSQWGGGQ